MGEIRRKTKSETIADFARIAEQLKQRFGNSRRKYEILPDAEKLTIYAPAGFIKNKIMVETHGDAITAVGGSIEEQVRLMLEVAEARGWPIDDLVITSGSLDFTKKFKAQQQQWAVWKAQEQDAENLAGTSWYDEPEITPEDLEAEHLEAANSIMFGLKEETGIPQEAIDTKQITSLYEHNFDKFLGQYPDGVSITSWAVNALADEVTQTKLDISVELPQFSQAVGEILQLQGMTMERMNDTLPFKVPVTAADNKDFSAGKSLLSSTEDEEQAEPLAPTWA